MSSDAVVVVGVRFQNAAQMHLAQDNDVVQALTPDRSGQPSGKAILPGRGWCGGLVPNAHGAQPACDDRTIDLIPTIRGEWDGLVQDEDARWLFDALTHAPIKRDIKHALDASRSHEAGVVA
jgi:hypothetical protein